MRAYVPSHLSTCRVCYLSNEQNPDSKHTPYDVVDAYYKQFFVMSV